NEGPRGAARFLLGALGPAVLLGAYHTACFGRPWRTPYDFHADPHTQLLVKEGYGFSWPRPRVLGELIFGLRRGFLFTQPIASAALALAGATSDWGFDVLVSWQSLWVMGPRAGSIVALLALDESGLAAASLSMLALAVALPVVVALLAGPRAEWLLAAALAPI